MFRVFGTQLKCRQSIAHLAAGDTNSYDQFVSDFEHAYAVNNHPNGMSMFSHHDSYGTLMAVSITPESIPFCPFSADWSESKKPD